MAPLPPDLGIDFQSSVSLTQNSTGLRMPLSSFLGISCKTARSWPSSDMSLCLPTSWPRRFLKIWGIFHALGMTVFNGFMGSIYEYYSRLGLYCYYDF